MSATTDKLKHEGSQRQAVIAGAVAGLVSRFCIAPLDVIKIRLQLQTHSLSDPLSHHGYSGPVYKGTLGTLRAVVQHEGVTALWKGNIPAELLYVAYGATQFSVYHGTSTFVHSLSLDNKVPDTLESFVSGAVAGGVATGATYPLDLLRTRFAAQGSDRIYSGIVGGVRDIWRHEGPRGFFRGLSAALAQIVPLMGLFFASYETLKQPLAGLDLPIGSSDACAGVMASVASKTVVFPLDTIRKRLQVQGPTRARYVHTNIPHYTGVVAAFRQVLKREGMRGFYRGLPVSLLKAAPASAVTMWTYERVIGALQQLED